MKRPTRKWHDWFAGDKCRYRGQVAVIVDPTGIYMPTITMPGHSKIVIAYSEKLTRRGRFIRRKKERIEVVLERCPHCREPLETLVYYNNMKTEKHLKQRRGYDEK